MYQTLRGAVNSKGCLHTSLWTVSTVLELRSLACSPVVVLGKKKSQEADLTTDSFPSYVVHVMLNEQEVIMSNEFQVKQPYL